MSIIDYLHPVWKRKLSDDSSANTAIIKALQEPLDEVEQVLIQNKAQLYLQTATGSWLDYWGIWMGLHRLKTWDDDTYRQRLINHVLHKRGTVYAIRDAIADFIQTNAQNIYIYEPYRNMLILNKSVYNGTDRLTDTYYRYAVIDVKIDAGFPQNVSDIINLFRPAGVLWVLTQDIHGISPDAPIINFNLFNNENFEENITDYAGLFYYDTLRLTPNIDDSIVVNNPFIYNDEDSLLNDGKEYLGGTSEFQNYMWIGQLFQDFTPLQTDTFNDTRPYGEQLSNNDLMLLSYNDTRGKIFNFSPVKDNLVSGSNKNTNVVQGTNTTYSVSNVKADSTYQIGAKVLSQYAYSNTSLYAKLGWAQNPSIGTNLVSDSEQEFSGQAYDFHDYHFASLTELTPGETYTMSFSTKVDDKAVNCQQFLFIDIYNSSWTWSAMASEWNWSVMDSETVSTDYQRVVYTFTVPEGQTGVNCISAYLSPPVINGTSDPSADNSDTAGTGYIKEFKLEKGSVATDWCPNPADNIVVGATLLSGVDQGNLWYTNSIQTPSWFYSDGTLTFYLSSTDNDPSVTLSYTTLKLQDSTKPLSYSLSSSDNYELQGLGLSLDVNHYLSTRSTEYTSTSQNSIHFIYSNMSLVMTLKAFSTNTSFTLYAYNYAINMWVNLSSYNIINSFSTINYIFDDVTPYLNTKGVMFLKVIPTDATISYDVDYVGLTFSNYKSSFDNLLLNQTIYSGATASIE